MTSRAGSTCTAYEPSAVICVASQSSPAPDAVGEDAHRQQRVVAPSLDDDEEGEQAGPQRDEADDDGRPPAVLGPGEAVDEAREAGGDDDRPDDVETVAPLGPALAHHEGGGDDGDEHDGHVDEQAPAPADELGQHSAEHESDGGTRARDGTEDGEGGVPVTAGREGRGEHGEGRRGEQGGEHALEAAGEDQLAPGLHEAAERRGGPEAHHADDEGALAPPEVGDAAAEQQQGAERERVGRDDPLAVLVAEAEVGLGVGQGDVDDGAVEDDDELREGDDDEHPPASR
jgi:hypothetical protein